MGYKSAKGRLLLAVVAPVLLFAAAAWGQTKKPVSFAELAAYSGADREQRLLAGARAEGKVVWYTSLAGSSYKELASAFEKKYPGVAIEPYRATSGDLMTRLVAEADARRFVADTIETTLPVLRYMRENKLSLPYTSPHLAKYPATAKEAAERGLVYWAVDRETYIGTGYNTKLIAAPLVPKSYADLLKPELKGKIGFATSDTGTRTVGAMLKFKGEEYIKSLKAQEPTLQSVSGRAMADMVISGEIAVSPTIFRDHALESKAKGAPIDWSPMEVVPTNAGAVSLLAAPPHPHAAILLADFLLGPAAQKILADLEYGSPFRPVSYKLWYPESGMSTAQYDREAGKWEKVLHDLGRRP